MKLPGYLRSRRILISISVIIILYGLAGFLIGPLWLRGFAEKQIGSILGEKSRASIESLIINPFTLSVHIKSLVITQSDDDNDRPALSIGKIYANAELDSVFGPRGHIRRIQITDPQIEVSRLADGSIDLVTLLTPMPAVAENDEAPTDSRSDPVRIMLDHLQVSGFSVVFSDQALKTPVTSHLDKFSVSLHHIDTGSNEKTGKLAIDGLVNQKGQLHVSGTIDAVAMLAEIDVNLENMPLSSGSGYLNEFTTLFCRDGILKLNFGVKVDALKAMPLEQFTLRKLAVNNLRIDQEELVAAFITGNFLVINLDVFPGESRVVGDLLSYHTGSILVERENRTTFNFSRILRPEMMMSNDPSEGDAADADADENVEAGNPAKEWNILLKEIKTSALTFNFTDQTLEQPASQQVVIDSFLITNVSTNPDQTFVGNLTLTINEAGKCLLPFTGSINPPAFNSDNFTVNSLKLDSISPYLEQMTGLNLSDGSFESSLAIDASMPPEQPLNLRASGSLSINNLSITQVTDDKPLLGWSALAVNGIKADLAANQLAVDKVTLTRPTAALVRPPAPVAEEDAEMAEIVDEAAPAGEEATDIVASGELTEEESTSMPIAFRLGEFELIDASAELEDQALQQPGKISVSQINGTIKNLSLAGETKSEIKLGGLINDYGKFDVTGNFEAADLLRDTAVKINLSNLELSHLSAWSGEYVGWNLARGKLKLELDYEIRDNRLDASNVIQMEKIDLGEKVESPNAAKVPLKLALAIMRDRNEDVILPPVGISGQLDDPSFQVTDVIIKAFMNIITKAVTAPFAMLGSVFGQGQDLSEITFVPGESELTPDAVKVLDALKNALYNRPGFSLELQGRIDPVMDSQVIRKRLLEEKISQRYAATQATAELETVRANPDEIPGDDVGQSPLDPQTYRNLLLVMYSEHQATLMATATPAGNVESTSGAITTGTGEAEVDGLPPATPPPDAADTAVVNQEATTSSDQDQEQKEEDSEPGALIKMVRTVLFLGNKKKEDKTAETSQVSGEETPAASQPEPPSTEESIASGTQIMPESTGVTPEAVTEEPDLPTNEEIEAVLLRAIEVSPHALKVLAEERAARATEYLLQGEEVTPERIFTIDPDAGLQDQDRKKDQPAVLFSMRK